MPSVLVTGATGFIGRYASRALLSRGFEVHTIVPSAREQERSVLDPAIRVHDGDLLNTAGHTALLRSIGATHVLHLAWYVVPEKFWHALENLDWLGASLSLMRAFAAAGGRRWVGAGTCAEYDWSHSGEFSEFDTPLRPSTLYGVAKRCLFEVQSCAAARLGIEFCWGRVFHLYGPGEARRRLVPSVIENLLADRPAPLGPGTQVRDFAHVEDVGRAFAALVSSDIDGPVNIGSGHRATIRAVAEIIAENMRRPGLLRIGALPPSDDPEQLFPALERLSGIGFQPRWDLPSGLEDTIQSFAAQVQP